MLQTQIQTFRSSLPERKIPRTRNKSCSSPLSSFLAYSLRGNTPIWNSPCRKFLTQSASFTQHHSNPNSARLKSSPTHLHLSACQSSAQSQPTATSSSHLSLAPPSSSQLLRPHSRFLQSPLSPIPSSRPSLPYRSPARRATHLFRLQSRLRLRSRL